MVERDCNNSVVYRTVPAGTSPSVKADRKAVSISNSVSENRTHQAPRSQGEMIKGERLHNNKHAVVVAITTSTVECTASSRLPHNFLHLPPRQSEDIWLLVQKKMK
jgi:hypothetical protein